MSSSLRTAEHRYHVTHHVIYHVTHHVTHHIVGIFNYVCNTHVLSVYSCVCVCTWNVVVIVDGNKTMQIAVDALQRMFPHESPHSSSLLGNPPAAPSYPSHIHTVQIYRVPPPHTRIVCV